MFAYLTTNLISFDKGFKNYNFQETNLTIIEMEIVLICHQILL